MAHEEFEEQGEAERQKAEKGQKEQAEQNTASTSKILVDEPETVTYDARCQFLERLQNEGIQRMEEEVKTLRQARDAQQRLGCHASRFRDWLDGRCKAELDDLRQPWIGPEDTFFFRCCKGSSFPGLLLNSETKVKPM